MSIKDLIIREDGIVHENDMRQVLEIFDGERIENLAKSCKAFIVKKDGWIADHYRDIWESYAVVFGEVEWFFEDMKTGEKQKVFVKKGGIVNIPPMVAHALKVKKGSIIVGRYQNTREKTKTNKYILNWARDSN